MLLSCGNPTSDDGPVTGTVTDIEGNTYNTIKIGNQVWMVENLRTTKFNDGSAIPHVKDTNAWIALTTPGYCYYNNTTDADSIITFGALYNWYAVDTKKLSPKGWHVPDSAEWYTLQNYLIANGYNWDGTTTDNKIAKSMAAKTDWNYSSEAGDVGNDLSSNNSSGFSALPGGLRIYDGIFYYIGFVGHWWSASESEEYWSDAYSRTLNYEVDNIIWGLNDKGCGFSVRLVKD